MFRKHKLLVGHRTQETMHYQVKRVIVMVDGDQMRIDLDVNSQLFHDFAHDCIFCALAWLQLASWEFPPPP